MYNKEIFINLVLKYYNYLLSDFQFTYEKFEEGRDDCLIFSKINFIVEIKFNKPNQYFDINIYKKLDSKFDKFNDYHFWSNININWIVIKKIGNKENIYSPTFNNLEENIIYKSNLLKEFGSNLLSEKEWYSWKDVYNESIYKAR